MSKLTTFEDIILHFDDEDIPLRKAQIIGLIDALDISDLDLMNLDPQARDYMIEHMFTDRQIAFYYNSSDPLNYFASTVAKCLF